MESLGVVHGLGGLGVWPPICAMLCGPFRDCAGMLQDNLYQLGGAWGVAFDLGHTLSSLLRFRRNAMG